MEKIVLMSVVPPFREVLKLLLASNMVALVKGCLLLLYFAVMVSVYLVEKETEVPLLLEQYLVGGVVADEENEGEDGK